MRLHSIDRLRAGACAALILYSALAGARQNAQQAEPQQPQRIQDLRTECELSEFTQYTSHEFQMEYLQAIQGLTVGMKLGIYGSSWEERELPYVVFSRPTIAQPWEAMTIGKPIIMFQGNVHGGERTLRESLLILIRELATPGTPANAVLDELVVIIAPQVNPDGFARSQRGNSWGIDLNRDYIKLEQKAIADLVKNMYNSWHPHLIIDGHNGGARPYNINYITSGNATPAKEIVDLCNNEIFPLVHRRIEENGMKAFYYPGGNEEYWQGAPTYPRICMTYACFSNALGITFESPGQSMADGVKAGVISFMAVLEYAATNPDKVIGTVNRARRETIAMGENPGDPVMVEMRAVDQDYTVSYEIRDADSPTGYRLIENGKLRTKPEVIASRPRPFAYILPRDARDAVAMLRRHDITVEVLQEPRRLAVDAYVIGGISYRSEYNHAGSPRVEVAEVVTQERNFPRGTFIVPTAQMMGRVVAHMLEPESDDNVVLWNAMDAWLPRPSPTPEATPPPDEPSEQAGGQRRGAAGERGAAVGERGQRGQRRGGRGRGGRGGGGGPAVVPIYKLMEPTALPTRLLDDNNW